MSKYLQLLSDKLWQVIVTTGKDSRLEIIFSNYLCAVVGAVDGTAIVRRRAR